MYRRKMLPKVEDRMANGTGCLSVQIIVLCLDGLSANISF